MIDTIKSTCRKCYTPFAGNAIGRPAGYCSSGCRRASEYEVRRLQMQLTSLEEQRANCRMDRSGLMYFPSGTAAERVADLTQEIKLAEARLRELLDGQLD